MANTDKDGTAKGAKTTTKAPSKAVVNKAVNLRLEEIAQEALERERAESEAAKDASIVRIAQVREKMTIKETKEVMVFAVSLVNAYRAAKADGVITGTDVQHIIIPMTLLVPAVSGANLIAAEMADLDDAEKLELVEEFAVIVRNPLYRRLFAAVVEMGDAIIEISQEKRSEDDPTVEVVGRNLGE